MSVFLIAQIRIEDEDRYQQYLDGFFPIFERYGGEFLASDPDTQVIEGEWAYPRTALMRFDSERAARSWLDSGEYRRLAKHRHQSASTNFVLVQGPPGED